MIILGVDPGSARTGYGAIATDGRRHRLLERGALAPPARLDLPGRLHFIHQGIAALIARLRPDAVAVEDVFHAANTRTALVLGHVRGVILLAVISALAAVLLFLLHAFAYVIALALLIVFGFGALVALAIQRSPGE
jgi:crossover junction endodeoxyribonuclease RuvC